jgi:hypothetical protein
LPLKLKEIAHKKLIFSMNQLKNKEPVYKTAQKLPTFRDSTIKGKIA